MYSQKCKLNRGRRNSHTFTEATRHDETIIALAYERSNCVDTLGVLWAVIEFSVALVHFCRKNIYIRIISELLCEGACLYVSKLLWALGTLHHFFAI